MNDVSVLLNLTGKLVFEKTNPLMDLVSGHGPFLFYDQISIKRFPQDVEEQESFVPKLLFDMKNLLGCLRLSDDDQGGTIRIIVTLDLVGDFFRQNGQTLCFPAQKVRMLLDMMNHVFENEPQLLFRFRYTFIFMEWDSDDRRLADFYRTLADEGCYGIDNWLSTNMLTLNKARDEMADRLKADLELNLDDSSIKKEYVAFQELQSAQEDRVSALMAQAGVAEEFRHSIRIRLKDVVTFGDFRDFDFDCQFKTVVSELIGLCSPMLDNCCFFIYKMRTDTTTHRKKDEMVFYSLLQLLGTIEDSWNARLSVVDGSMNEHSLNTDALAGLKGEVSDCLSLMKDDGNLRKLETDKVEYRVFSANNENSSDANAHHEYNEEVKGRRKELYENFKRTRRIPFFFGSNQNDWKWYFNVSQSLNEIYVFETENNRPRYNPPKRITEKKMKEGTKTTCYADLKEEKKKLEDTIRQKSYGDSSEDKRDSNISCDNLLADLKVYLGGRNKAMNNLAKHKEELKKEMVKLGFASITWFISFLICLIVTICYSFHFFYTGNLAETVWVGACLAAVCLICLLAAMLSQSHIKSAIKDIYVKIDDCREIMDNLEEEYFNKIKKRVSLQNEADIQRRNLEEIQEKLKGFNWNNMQASLWEKHFSCMKEKLEDMLQYTETPIHTRKQNKVGTSVHDVLLWEIPCLPESISAKYKAMSVTLYPSGTIYNNVTCFLKCLNVTFLN